MGGTSREEQEARRALTSQHPLKELAEHLRLENSTSSPKQSLCYRGPQHHPPGRNSGPGKAKEFGLQLPSMVGETFIKIEARCTGIPLQAQHSGDQVGLLYVLGQSKPKSKTPVGGVVGWNLH